MITTNSSALSMYKSIIELNQPSKDVSLIVVQHVVPNTIPFFQYLNSSFDVRAIVPKPNSIDDTTIKFFEQSEKLPLKHVKKEQLKDSDFVKKFISGLKIPEKNSLIILDVGGYFSTQFETIYDLLEGRLLGIVEDTENGHQKYQSIVGKKKTVKCPILSVARSPLKEPEDFLVGQSIVYAIERGLRDDSTILTNKQVLVIGYGKIGKSIANSISSRNVSVWVYDHDPIRSAQALAHGFNTPEREMAIRKSDLIVGATGNKSMSQDDFLNLKNDCYVASVTSADDEFEIDKDKFAIMAGSNGLFVYHLPNGATKFNFLNDGNAVNFQYSNVLGPYIYLVACELIYCIKKMITSDDLSLSKINSLRKNERQTVAKIWNGYFGKTIE